MWLEAGTVIGAPPPPNSVLQRGLFRFATSFFGIFLLNCNWHLCSNAHGAFLSYFAVFSAPLFSISLLFFWESLHAFSNSKAFRFHTR